MVGFITKQSKHAASLHSLRYSVAITLLSLMSVGMGSAQTNYLPDNMDSVGCVIAPEPQPWAIVQGRASEYRSHMYALPFVGDIDHDGRSEVVTAGVQTPYNSSSIVIYDDQLQHLATISTPEMYSYVGYPLALADVDRDGFGEIFVHTRSGYLYCYRYDGNTVTTVWTSNTPTSLDATAAILIIADINGDGHPVIWALNKIYNAVTGVELLTLPEVIGTFYCSTPSMAAMPVFADFDNDGVLEFAGGNKVYKLHISDYNSTVGNSAELWKTISGNGIGDGVTSFADIDLDGYLDMVVVWDDYMYAWKPFTGIGSEPTLISICPYTAIHPASRALIADVDNDGYPEILFSYAYGMTAYRYNPATRSLQQMWQQQTSDDSGCTSMTAFDFNLDGNVEVVYRDMTHLRILNGATGEDQTRFDCMAPTATECPVVVDLDRDGQTEIIVSYNHYVVDHDPSTQLIVFHAPANTTWAPARYVWNQHAYNTVNVNNDLTIPTTNFNPATAFTGPDNVVRRPFNNFLQQATTLDQYGRPFAQLMNLAIIGEPSVEFQNDVVVVEMEVCNTGGAPFAPPMHITVYTDSGQVVQTAEFSVALQPGDCEDITLIIGQTLLEPFDNPYPLRIAINDRGEGTAQYGGLSAECDTSDNYWSIEGTPCKLKIPNIITPNNDGYNDVLVPITMEGEYSYLRMDIYDRWGKRVWHQEDADELLWDASKLSDGVYYCAIEYFCKITGRKKYLIHTSVTVIR